MAVGGAGLGGLSPPTDGNIGGGLGPPNMPGGNCIPGGKKKGGGGQFIPGGGGMPIMGGRGGGGRKGGAPEGKSLPERLKKS